MGLISLYLNALKSHPIRTNLSTAALLMVGGDVIAQEIERCHLEDEFSFHEHDLDGVPDERRLHMHPYSGFFVRRRTSGIDDNVGTETYANQEGAAISNPFADASTQMYNRLSQSITRSIDENDWVRSATMGIWAIFFYTPAYMGLYAAFDRIFQKRTPLAISSRVAGAVVYSIPINALFFLYGTSVHHTLEWYGLWNSLLSDAEEEAEWTELSDEKESLFTRMKTRIATKLRLKRQETEKQIIQETRIEEIEEEEATNAAMEEIRRRFFLPLPDRPPPYDSDMLLSKARLKIETELISTVKTSAQIWVPINFVNFAFVPNHLRPFGLLFFSVFWNCYLSLVQHRDIPLPT